jgi:predicted lipoprotein with Yx(FWY)xxD motif
MRSSVTVKVAVVAKYGHILVDQAGMALYFDKADKPPKHWACTGGCLSAWPPLVLGKGQMAAAHAKSLTGLGAVHGPSGLQVTWDGKPLYTYVGDSKGQVSGQGLGGVWYVAQVKTKM